MTWAAPSHAGVQVLDPTTARMSAGDASDVVAAEKANLMVRGLGAPSVGESGPTGTVTVSTMRGELSGRQRKEARAAGFFWASNSHNVASGADAAALTLSAAATRGTVIAVRRAR